jgi:hypothetical protein
MYEEEGDDGELLADSETAEGDGEVDSEGGIKRQSHEVNLVQFRQISVNEEMSCGLTLIGAHILCWGGSMHFRRGTMPRHVKGPFRQLSVGNHGFCAITADPEEEGEEGEGESSSTGETQVVADQLQCWGSVRASIDPKRFEAWDQIKVDPIICGVSMESELECWGSPFFPPYNTMHREIVIA